MSWGRTLIANQESETIHRLKPRFHEIYRKRSSFSPKKNILQHAHHPEESIGGIETADVGEELHRTAADQHQDAEGDDDVINFMELQLGDPCAGSS